MNEENEVERGLGQVQEEWPSLGTDVYSEAPIDRLRPGSELHAKVLSYLKERLDMSEREMRNFYSRWEAAEKRYQAYIKYDDLNSQLREANDSGERARVVDVTIPYSMATISTIVTYLLHTFTSRKPMFQIGSYKKESVKGSRMMELVMQYNADHTRLVKHLFQFLQDGEMYGVGVLRTRWKTEKGTRTVWRQNNPLAVKLLGKPPREATKEERTIYSGNDVASVDPFMFFPDPRVPMQEVNRRGEFVFWRVFDGKHMLKREEAAGLLKYVDHAGSLPVNTWSDNTSARSILAGGSSQPGVDFTQTAKARNFIQVDQGTVELIPAELGLGDSEVPEKWLFTILNKKQIVQAEPLDNDHGMHPVVVSEPYSLGYGFGHLGMSDYSGTFQDTISWLVNSHMDNVKTALNNMWIVDPSMVEMQDLKNPGAGKIIRLKQSFWGRDVRTALQQLQVQDVTRTHLQDLEIFSKLSDMMSSVTDNLRGTQDAGGRKSATEARTAAEAAASRLAAHARLISSQAIVDLTEQMAVNIQQYMDEEFYISLVGVQGYEAPIQVAPEMLVGDFYYPVHDGTLPLDRIALLDVWKELLGMVAQDPELRGTYSLGQIFEYVAELGGAKNIEQFRVQMNVASDDAVAEALAGGPAPQATPMAPPASMGA